MAPFSVSNAFAHQSQAAWAYGAGEQQLAVAEGADPTFDVSVSAIVERTAGSTADGVAPATALYTLQQFMFAGAVNWGGYKFTYYSQQVLPGAGLEIPGRHVNAGGYVSDADGYIVLAGSAPKGTVYSTPFGYQGKIYDRGTVGNHLDVYIR